MAELKTKENNSSVKAFLNSVKDEQKRKDCEKLLNIFERATGEKEKMWGDSIVGFGKYHYKSERSSQEGDWPLTGFSPRKNAITLYIMSGFSQHKELLNKLGKHKISGGSCLYINKLENVDLKVLTTLIKASIQEMKKRYKV